MRNGRRGGGGDDGVSDVVGSILLVAITVVMAAAFAFLLFQFKGPPDQLHARLGVVIGPGNDLTWNTGDETITLTHNGGEPLVASQVKLTYTVGTGTRRTVTAPGFPGGTLTVGETYVQVLADPVAEGVGLSLQVVVNDPTGSRVLLDANASGGTGVAIPATYAYAANFTAGKGTVATFLPNIRSATDSGAFAALTEAGTGGPVTSTLTGTSGTGSGATNPGNVLASDNQYAVLDANAEWAQASGFSAPAGATTVTSVVLGMEANGTAGITSTVAHQQTVTGTGSGATVSATGLTATAGNVYLAAISNGEANLRTVTGVSGLGLTWAKVAEAQASSTDKGRLEVWVGTGASPSGTTVTATFSGNTQAAAIVVSRYSGVNTANPVQASQASDAPGTGASTWSLASIAGTLTQGRLYAAVNAVDQAGVNFVTPATTGKRADVDSGGHVQLGVADGVAALANAASGTISPGAVDWQAIALTLRPAPNPDPVVSLSYLVNGVAGTATLSQSLPSTEAVYTLDVTADRAWTVANIGQAAVRVTATTLNGGTVNVDRAYLTVTTSSGATTYALQVVMGFDPVPAGVVQTVQVGYSVTSPGDTFQMVVYDGSSWATSRTCAGTLSATSPSAFACTLVLPGEWRSGAPLVRFVDSTPTGTAQGTLRLDYVRVATL